MGYTLNTDVMVLACDEPASKKQAGETKTLRSRWPLVRVTKPAAALRQVQMCRPQLVLVHVCSWPQPQIPVNLILALRNRAPRCLVVAYATRHDDELEKTIRTAGAGCYIPHPPPPALIASLVEQHAARRAAAPVKAAAGTRPPRARAHGPPATTRGQPTHPRPP